MDALKIFKCLSDPSRIRMIRALQQEPMYGERLAHRLGLAVSTVSFHLKKLEEAGIVKHTKEQYYQVYRLNDTVLSRNLLELLNQTDIHEDDFREQQYKEDILKRFFVYGKLKTIPVQHKKRAIVLSEIAKDFNEDTLYKESEVNQIILQYHEDFCTIRRDMIALGLLAREKNMYRRSKKQS